MLQPWKLVLVGLAGWVNRRQQAVIDFQGTQIQVLMEDLGKKRLLLNDDQHHGGRRSSKSAQPGRLTTADDGSTQRVIKVGGCGPAPASVSLYFKDA